LPQISQFFILQQSEYTLPAIHAYHQASLKMPLSDKDMHLTELLLHNKIQLGKFFKRAKHT